MSFMSPPPAPALPATVTPSPTAETPITPQAMPGQKPGKKLPQPTTLGGSLVAGAKSMGGETLLGTAA